MKLNFPVKSWRVGCRPPSELIILALEQRERNKLIRGGLSYRTAKFQAQDNCSEEFIRNKYNLPKELTRYTLSWDDFSTWRNIKDKKSKYEFFERNKVLTQLFH